MNPGLSLCTMLLLIRASAVQNTAIRPASVQVRQTQHHTGVEGLPRSQGADHWIPVRSRDGMSSMPMTNLPLGKPLAGQ